MVSDSNLVGMCQFSHLKSGFEKYTSHYVDEHEFIKDLINICKKEVNLILPSHNETEIIARHRHKFSNSLVALVPDASHCQLFNNKSYSYDLVEKLGIPVPTRVNYSDPQKISELIKKAGFKRTVIKLLTGNSSKGVFYGNDAEHTQSIVQELIENYKLNKERFPQIEEYVEGDGYGNSVLYWRGKQIANFSHKRLRDKIDTGGTSTYREACSHAGIENAARTIFDSIGWHGLAMCEFKVCPKTGKFWFIEVNPRMWGSISLAIESGVEFPYLAWLCANQGPTAALAYYKNCDISSNWKARWLLGDIFVILSNIFRLKFRPVWQILKGNSANSIDDFFWNDPFVFWGELFAYIKAVILKGSTNPSDKGMLK